MKTVSICASSNFQFTTGTYSHSLLHITHYSYICLIIQERSSKHYLNYPLLVLFADSYWGELSY